MTVSELEQTIQKMKKSGEINNDTEIVALWYANSECGEVQDNFYKLSVESRKLILRTETMRFYDTNR